MASESAENLEGDINVAIQSPADSEEKPGLVEIKSLLLAINRSINCSVSSLLSDNKALRGTGRIKGLYKFQQPRTERTQGVVTKYKQRKQGVKNITGFY